MLFATLGFEPVVALESDERGSWLEAVVARIGSVLWYGERASATLERGAARQSHFVPPIHRPVGLVHAREDRRPEVAAILDVVREVGLPGWAQARPIEAADDLSRTARATRPPDRTGR